MIYTVQDFSHALCNRLISYEGREPSDIPQSIASQHISIVAHEICKEAQEVSIVSSNSRELILESPSRETNT